jgi:hypothetical protein
MVSAARCRAWRLLSPLALPGADLGSRLPSPALATALSYLVLTSQPPSPWGVRLMSVLSWLHLGSLSCCPQAPPGLCLSQCTVLSPGQSVCLEHVPRGPSSPLLSLVLSNSEHWALTPEQVGWGVCVCVCVAVSQHCPQWEGGLRNPRALSFPGSRQL